MRAGLLKFTSSGPSSPTSAQPPWCRPPSAKRGISALRESLVLMPIASATLLNTRAMPSFQTVLMTQLIGSRNLFAIFRHAESMLLTASDTQPAMFSTPCRNRSRTLSLIQSQTALKAFFRLFQAPLMSSTRLEKKFQTIFMPSTILSKVHFLMKSNPAFSAFFTESQAPLMSLPRSVNHWPTALSPDLIGSNTLSLIHCHATPSAFFTLFQAPCMSWPRSVNHCPTDPMAFLIASNTPFSQSHTAPIAVLIPSHAPVTTLRN